MKEQHKRVFAAILALLLTGCTSPAPQSEAESKVETKQSAETTAAETEETETDRAHARDSLPDDLDLNGETISILYRGYAGDVIEIYADDLTGETVADAVYMRNLSVAERLNCTFAYHPEGSNTWDAFPTAAKSAIIAGTDDYSFFSWNQFSSVALCLENLVMDIMDAPYIDLEKPWWNSEYMDILQIGDQKRFYLMGDICLNALRVTAATFFNQKLYADLFGDPAELYSLVLDGKWTVDKLQELSEAGYVDKNGDGKVNVGDQFGTDTTTVSHCDYFAYGCGFTVVDRDEKGMPRLVLENEQNYSIVQRLCDFYWKSGNAVYIEEDANGAFSGTVFRDAFSSDTVVFMPHRFKFCEELRDMESDYGIIPYPKYNEAQEEYRSLVHDAASVFFIPTSCQNRDDVCAVLEAMCAETYRTVMPAYYEVALKRQYARDDVSAQMIDLIHDTSITDFGYVYNYSIGSVGTIMRGVIAGNGNIASTVAAAMPKAQAELDKLIATYMDTGE